LKNFFEMLKAKGKARLYRDESNTGQEDAIFPRDIIYSSNLA